MLGHPSFLSKDQKEVCSTHKYDNYILLCYIILYPCNPWQIDLTGLLCSPLRSHKIVFDQFSYVETLSE